MPENPAHSEIHSTIHTTTAALSVMADHVERYQQEVAELVPSYQQHQRDDVVTALVEAERALRTAARCLRRSAKLAGTAN